MIKVNNVNKLCPGLALQAAVLLAAGLVLAAGCGSPTGGGGGGDDPVTVSAFNLSGLVTRPVKNTAPDTTAINEAQY